MRMTSVLVDRVRSLFLKNLSRWVICTHNEMRDSQRSASLLLSRLSWCDHVKTEGCIFTCQWQERRTPSQAISAQGEMNYDIQAWRCLLVQVSLDC